MKAEFAAKRRRQRMQDVAKDSPTRVWKRKSPKAPPAATAATVREGAAKHLRRRRSDSWPAPIPRMNTTAAAQPRIEQRRRRRRRRLRLRHRMMKREWLEPPVRESMVKMDQTFKMKNDNRLTSILFGKTGLSRVNLFLSLFASCKLF